MQALEQATSELFTRFRVTMPNLVGVGVGYKTVGNRPTETLAIVYGVRMKVPRPESIGSTTVPESVTVTVDGEQRLFPTDVVSMPPFRFLTIWHLAIQGLLARPGATIINNGHRGTLGALLRDADTGAFYALSCSHVMSLWNQYGPGHAIRLLQGNDAIAFATLHKASRFTTCHPMTTDAAIAKLDTRSRPSPRIPRIGYPASPIEPSLNMPVRKYGSATGYTSGKITYVAATVLVDKGYTFTKVLLANMVAARGDSGALAVESDSRAALGLVFASNGFSTAVCRIDIALNALGLTNVVWEPPELIVAPWLLNRLIGY